MSSVQSEYMFIIQTYLHQYALTFQSASDTSMFDMASEEKQNKKETNYFHVITERG